MGKAVTRSLVIALILIAVGIASIGYYWFWVEHVTYEKRDATTGLQFVASCQYSESSFRSYVTVRSPAGRVISRNEIPFSADELSDCTRQQYYAVADLVPDQAFNKLSVQFADRRRSPVEVPLLLDGIDLPNSPRPPVQRTAR
jgi:hypothetical protein